MSEVLLIVALKTDQPDIQNRVRAVLAVAHPVNPDTEPCVFAREVAELTANDYDHLAYFMDVGGIERLRIGTVSGAA